MGKNIVLAALLITLLLTACTGGDRVNEKELAKARYFAKVDLLLDQYCVDGTDCSPGFYYEGAFLDVPKNCNECDMMHDFFLYGVMDLEGKLD